jgi:hypothetical protein
LHVIHWPRCGASCLPLVEPLHLLGSRWHGRCPGRGVVSTRPEAFRVEFLRLGLVPWAACKTAISLTWAVSSGFPKVSKLARLHLGDAGLARRAEQAWAASQLVPVGCGRVWVWAAGSWWCDPLGPSVWPRRARIAESLLGATVVATTACSLPTGFLRRAPPGSRRGETVAAPPATSRWRDADSAPARRRSQDTVPPAVQPAYVVIARRHGLDICGHLVRSAQGKPRNRDRSCCWADRGLTVLIPSRR